MKYGFTFATTRLDTKGQRFSPGALQQMARQAPQQIVFDGDPVGVIRSAEIQGDELFCVKETIFADVDLEGAMLTINPHDKSLRPLRPMDL